MLLRFCPQILPLLGICVVAGRKRCIKQSGRICSSPSHASLKCDVGCCCRWSLAGEQPTYPPLNLYLSRHIIHSFIWREIPDSLWARASSSQPLFSSQRPQFCGAGEETHMGERRKGKETHTKWQNTATVNPITKPPATRKKRSMVFQPVLLEGAHRVWGAKSPRRPAPNLASTHPTRDNIPRRRRMIAELEYPS